jgi:hypothetical protein
LLCAAAASTSITSLPLLHGLSSRLSSKLGHGACSMLLVRAWMESGGRRLERSSTVLVHFLGRLGHLLLLLPSIRLRLSPYPTISLSWILNRFLLHPHHRLHVAGLVFAAMSMAAPHTPSSTASLDAAMCTVVSRLTAGRIVQRQTGMHRRLFLLLFLRQLLCQLVFVLLHRPVSEVYLRRLIVLVSFALLLMPVNPVHSPPHTPWMFF